MTHSAIVITMDRPREVAALLDALATQEQVPDEIIVVDASADGATRAAVAECAARNLRTRIRHLAAPANISGQKNAGLDASTGDVVSFFDDDVALPPHYCSAILRRFASDTAKRIGGLAGLQMQARRSAWPLLLYRKAFLLQSDRGRNRFRISGFPDFGFSFDEETGVDFLASTAVSFRRSAIGDTRFDDIRLTGAALGLATGRGFAEDVEFSSAVARHAALLVLPELRFRHDKSPSNRENTEITQALYVHAMRMVSDAHARGALSRLARWWALCGQGGLCLAQSLWYRDAGYVRGYWMAIRNS